MLRIEDTDRDRSREEFEKDIMEGLRWLGFSYDGFSRQSERKEIHRAFLKKLIDRNLAYVSEEKEGSGQRDRVIRLRNPGRSVTFRDEIRGDITFDTKELGDFVIAKSEDEPLYHLAVVVDDFESGVTHVIRGEDHISNTPRQILIGEAIGAPRPVYAHLPLILAPDRTKLSKRHGAASLLEYRTKGYLSEAVNNFLALLGWSPQGRGGENAEVFTLDDLIRKFSLEKVGKSGTVFNMEKLNWLNREHIKRMPEDKLEKHMLEAVSPKLRQFPEWDRGRFAKIIPILTERIVKFSDVTEMTERGELDYFFRPPAYETEKLFWKNDPGGGTIRLQVDDLIEELGKIPLASFNEPGIKDAVTDFIGSRDRGSILWPMRYALTGLNKSPDPFTVAAVLGKEETLRRLKTAAGKLHV